jgi:hypothetical protein
MYSIDVLWYYQGIFLQGHNNDEETSVSAQIRTGLLPNADWRTFH